MNYLRTVDLNLLVTLEALLTECNVTRAARRLALSQPSVSVQLRRLRALFDDPLLVPITGGMTPTARGQALLEPTRATLASVRRLLEPPVFDARVAAITWRIGAADYAAQTIVLPLLAHLRGEAPKMRLAVSDGSHERRIEQLLDGQLDLSLMALDTLPERLRHSVLFHERYVLAGRKNHPALKREMTLTAFSRLSFVLVSPDGGGFKGATDTALASRRRQRTVVASVPHFAVVPEALQTTDLVAMLPERLVRHRRDLRLVEPPLAVAGYAMAMVWHERSQHDPAHQWLREQIHSCLDSAS